ncbi:MAG: tetratricopeptide repeat protein [Ktedonobacteraceae bacterium]
MSKHLETSPNNLPTQLSSFIGRERAIAELKSLLSTTRLLTLTGAGGSGKTRLALQVATTLLAEFEHGVWWVELASLTDPVLVPQQVASSLGLSEQPGRSLMDTLTGALQPRKPLLVLDNCEHLVAACAHLVETLLRSCPGLHILTTSREAFNIPGETIWLVPSLGVPDAYHLPPIEGLVKYESVQLFIERATSVLPAFRLTQENAPVLVQVCHRLDGLPLAIELAAARVKVLSLEQIATRLDHSYRLLAGGSRTALPRQQTLQATIEWSYHLLPEKERILFRRLSVFLGSFALEAAEAVCAGNGLKQDEVLDLLSHLVDKSLVAVTQRSGEARYRLLETIRQYAQEKLHEFGEAAPMRRNHRDWYARLAEQAKAETLEARQGSWFERLEAEHENLRVALGWSLDQQEAETAARIGAGIFRFWLLRGYISEGRLWMERALSGFSEKNAVRAQALNVAVVLTIQQDDSKRAKTLAEESLDLCRELADRKETGYALNTLGWLAHNEGDYAGAVTFFEESLALFRELGQKHDIALVLSSLGLTVLSLGEYERAAALCEESLAISRERGDPSSIASVLTNLGIITLARGDVERAKELCEESLARRKTLVDKGGCAHTLTILGRIALIQGDDERATACYKESLTLRLETGEKEGIATALEGLAAVAGMQGQPVRAVRLYGSAQSLRTMLGAPLTPIDRSSYEQTVAAVRALFDEPTFLNAWTEGQAMPLVEAIAEAAQVKVREHITPSPVPAPLDTPSTSPFRGNPFGLTDREIEVLRLVTQGLTTLQIAERLIISPRTADAHLRSIYSKLGVTSRAAATRSAIEHKLV